MKSRFVFLAIVIIGLVFLGCREDNFVQPTYTDIGFNTPSQNLSWLALPQTKMSNITDTYSESAVISGAKGGKVDLKWRGSDDVFGVDYSIRAKLDIPQHAFDDDLEMTFTVTVDNGNTYVDFDPHPMTFDIPLKFDLEYTGIDLSGYTEEDLENIVFAYIVDGEIVEYTGYHQIRIDLDKGKISVQKVEIEHFSRFGFCR